MLCSCMLYLIRCPMNYTVAITVQHHIVLLKTRTLSSTLNQNTSFVAYVATINSDSIVDTEIVSYRVNFQQTMPLANIKTTCH